MGYVIRYNNRGTTNGVVVGLVYVRHCPEISEQVYSYTRDPAEATQFETAGDARAALYDEGRPRNWPDADVIPLADAAIIAGPS